MKKITTLLLSAGILSLSTNAVNQAYANPYLHTFFKAFGLEKKYLKSLESEKRKRLNRASGHLQSAELNFNQLAGKVGQKNTLNISDNTNLDAFTILTQQANPLWEPQSNLRPSVSYQSTFGATKPITTTFSSRTTPPGESVLISRDALDTLYSRINKLEKKVFKLKKKQGEMTASLTHLSLTPTTSSYQSSTDSVGTPASLIPLDTPGESDGLEGNYRSLPSKTMVSPMLDIEGQVNSLISEIADLIPQFQLQDTPAVKSPAEKEAELWRTFTTLIIYKETAIDPSLTSVMHNGTHKEIKWSAWGDGSDGYTFEELRAKFQGHPFFENAFEIGAPILKTKTLAIEGQPGTLLHDEESYNKIANYFLNSTALSDPTLDTEKDSYLIKAYTIRKLHKELMESTSSSLQQVMFDHAKSLKEGYIVYNQSPRKIFDVEQEYKDTPWHQLFLSKVAQAAVRPLIYNLNNFNLYGFDHDDWKIAQKVLNATSLDEMDTFYEPLRVKNQARLKQYDDCIKTYHFVLPAQSADQEDELFKK